MATVETLRDFFFHVWETQMCSAAKILDGGKIKSSSPLLITWGRKSTAGFMEILANEKPQKSRVTVFFDDKKQP